jgi:hypothetical protein
MNPLAGSRRWELLRDWYVGADEWARGGLTPMIDLLGWVNAQPFAAELYGHTSHEALCVARKPGYDRDQPFFSCNMHPDGLMRFIAWRRVGSESYTKSVTQDQANETFAEFARLLPPIRSERAIGDADAEELKG